MVIYPRFHCTSFIISQPQPIQRSHACSLLPATWCQFLFLMLPLSQTKRSDANFCIAKVTLPLLTTQKNRTKATTYLDYYCIKKKIC